MKYTNLDNDYSNVWINLQAEVKMLHHYCLVGDWETARACSLNCKDYAQQLSVILKEMSDIDAE